MKSLLLASLVLASTLSHAQVANTNGPGNLAPSNLSLMSRIEQSDLGQVFESGKIKVNQEYGGFSFNKECAIGGAGLTGGFAVALAASSAAVAPALFLGGMMAISCLERHGEIKSKELNTTASVNISSQHYSSYGSNEVRNYLRVSLETKPKKNCPPFKATLISQAYAEGETNFDLHLVTDLYDQTLATLELKDNKAILTTTTPLVQADGEKCLLEIPEGTVINLRK